MQHGHQSCTSSQLMLMSGGVWKWPSFHQLNIFRQYPNSWSCIANCLHCVLNLVMAAFWREDCCSAIIPSRHFMLPWRQKKESNSKTENTRTSAFMTTTSLTKNITQNYENLIGETPSLSPIHLRTCLFIFHSSFTIFKSDKHDLFLHWIKINIKPK